MRDSAEPVLVVGGGPVGLTAALLLARANVPVLVVEAAHERAGVGSRSICVQRDVLEILERVGVGRLVADSGVTWRTSRTYYQEREVATTTFPETAGFPPFVNIPQTTVELILEERVRREPLVEMRYGFQVTGLSQDGRSVTVTDGRAQVRGSHCVAADGARSTVRKLLDLPFVGHAFADRFLIADVLVDLGITPAERRLHFDPPSNRDRQILLHPQPGGVWRIDWQIGEGSAPVESRIRAIVGDRPHEVLWQSTYRFNHRCVPSMRAGRVLLAGDAAHVMGPFGARGMNSGICDADNAAWKIAFDRRGEAGPGLLASYDTERRAAASENLRITDDTMRFFIPQTERERTMRRRALETGEGINSGVLFTPNSYRDSPLTTSGGDLLPGSRRFGPDFTIEDDLLIRPDGHVAANHTDSAARRRALGW